ncbi:barstar family protein [Cyanobacteria bacterium FACHB-DQ100]|uniref:barstar family protein n=1 Tax=Leptolyngbya sp. DQ-M1 TaxID=2933920 RepID=UPI0019A4D6C9|nr:barstar family protein [Cyanobacteria bacterium FACHB-DQ100]
MQLQQRSALDLQAEAVKSASQPEVKVFYLDGRKIASKEEFLREVAEAMDFPTYFGYNWDAFDECIRDLNWLPAQKYIVIYDRPDIFARAQPEQWQIAQEILQSAAHHWQESGRLMEVWVLSLLN